MLKTNNSLQSVISTVAKKATKESIVNTDSSLRHKVRVGTGKDTATRQAQGLFDATNVNTTAPNFYSPFTSKMAWEIPNVRKEVYLWSQYFVEREPKVAAGIDFYSTFPFSGFKLECGNNYVKSYYEELIKKLKLRQFLPEISRDYYMLGDSFIMATINCKECNGTNFNKKHEPCKHDGATWSHLSRLASDQVEIKSYFNQLETFYYINPTEDMIKTVTEQYPTEVVSKMSPDIQKLILSRQPIRLSDECIYHFKHGSSNNSPYGVSLITRLMPTLAYKDKLRQAQWLVAERHILPVRLVQVGSAERPASEEDIDDVHEQMTQIINDPLLTLVTHHDFKLDFVGASGKVLTLTNEYELINEDILDGLMLNKAILNGEGPTYANAQIGLNFVARRLESFREEVKYWIEEKLFKSVAEWNGFTVEGKAGEQKLIYPTIKWDDLNLKDNSNALNQLLQAYDKGIVSAQTLMEEMGLNYDQEIERLRFEQSASFIQPGPASEVDGMGGGFTGGMGGGVPSMGGMEDIGSLVGGMGGGGEMPPMEPSSETFPTGPMASISKNKWHKLSVNLMNDIYTSYIPDKSIYSSNYKRFKSAAHKNFLNYTKPVNGRGYCGKFEESDIIDYGDLNLQPLSIIHARPLNYIAQKEYHDEIRKVYSKKEIQLPKAQFTQLEKKLYNLILQAHLPYAFYAQYAAGPSFEYQLDGAFPALKLGIEADSETFHNNSRQIMSDRQRDSVLASQGWTILRFTEDEIEDRGEQIIMVIINAINKLNNISNKNKL